MTKRTKPSGILQPSLFSAHISESLVGAERLGALGVEARACVKCSLHAGRSTVVLGSGNTVQPLVAFVGEAPGETEDLTGVPFVGRAGMQLMRMIASMGFAREDVFLVNAVLCRPEENRTPTKSEIRSCSGFLATQLLAVKPKIIVCLGKVATQSLLDDNRALDLLRGYWFEWESIPVRVTYHPSFLIRPEGEGYRAHAWLDLQEVLTKLGLPIPTVEAARARVAAVPQMGFEAFVETRTETESTRRAIAIERIQKREAEERAAAAKERAAEAKAAFLKSRRKKDT